MRIRGVFYAARLLPILILMQPALPATSRVTELEEAQTEDDIQEITSIDLEDLMNVTVTSPGKKAESMNRVPAAIYVIRGEDLQRNGVTILPEALRQVPGFQVARQDANSWAISARGFNSTAANKLLVLVDGRSVYSPLHSGVFWDVQDTLLEDIDRIEVIRGPGGSLWGSNAINGVVNVITKSAAETQGIYAHAGAGIETRALGGVRYGFPLSEDDHMRVYAKYLDFDEGRLSADTSQGGHDGLVMGRAGFRSDWMSGLEERFTLQGDVYDGKAQTRPTVPLLTSPFTNTFEDRTDLQGGNLLWKWMQDVDADSGFQLQLYYDYVVREDETFKEDQHTGDLDFQYQFTPVSGHDVVWGLGYRIYRSDIDGTFFVSSDPAKHTDDIVSAFIQDEIALIDDKLAFTLGSKFEHNDYSGFEIQPSARLGWIMDERNMSWISASRAVRTPSILDVDLRINALTLPGSPPTVLAVIGSEDFASEDLIALEAGYRTLPLDTLSFDLAIFHNTYDNLRSLEPGATFSESNPQPAHDVSPFFIENENRAKTYGAELAANLHVQPWWLISTSYTYLYLNLQPRSQSADPTGENDQGLSPRNQVWIRSSMDLNENLSLDLISRYVGRLKTSNVDSYIEADMRLAWSNTPRNVEIALVGQNLVEDHHKEFGGATTGSEVERSGYLLVTVRF